MWVLLLPTPREMLNTQPKVLSLLRLPKKLSASPQAPILTPSVVFLATL